MAKKADGRGRPKASPGRKKRPVAVSLSNDDCGMIDQAAASEGLSRSAFIREAAVHRAVTVLALDHQGSKPAKRP